MRTNGGLALLRHELLSMSQSEEWETAKTEWQLHDCFWNNSYGRCLCGHDINERCVITNTVTDRAATVGNCCVKQFLGHLTSTSDAVFASLKRVHLDDNKSLHPDLVDLAESLGDIAPWAAELYKKLIRKRVLSHKQLAFRVRQNRRILGNAPRHVGDTRESCHSHRPWSLSEEVLSTALQGGAINAWEYKFYSGNLSSLCVSEKQRPIKLRIEDKAATSMPPETPAVPPRPTPQQLGEVWRCCPGRSKGTRARMQQVRSLAAPTAV